MGVLFDYFVAGSDEQAAVTIDWLQGPSHPSASGPTADPYGTSGRSDDDLGDFPSGFRTVSDTGIEPVVQAATLEGLLTGRSVDDILESLPEAPVAIRDGGERLVLQVSGGLIDVLAQSTPERLAEVAVLWSQTEEFWGQGDPEFLRDLLGELAQLARHARAEGEVVYCWVCV
ncbi:hypothetical protein [Branchiibius cervicis]|uniref:DUF1877 family protein n=1 Tax=Branchiibius cervicis TaxID=908252 RepID=A0ABW2AWZ1_9MICO